MLECEVKPDHLLNSDAIIQINNSDYRLTEFIVNSTLSVAGRRYDVLHNAVTTTAQPRGECDPECKAHTCVVRNCRGVGRKCTIFIR